MMSARRTGAAPAAHAQTGSTASAAPGTCAAPAAKAATASIAAQTSLQH